MSVNSYIDHTLLKADANEEQIYALIDEAKKYQFASVCESNLGKDCSRTFERQFC